VALATDDVPAGAERIARGAQAYLDVCLENESVKALALEAPAAASQSPRRALRRFLGA